MTMTTSNAAGINQCVLLIDDEEAIRYSFRRIFSNERVKVLTAATAQEGVELFRDQHPDVVVLDLQLPDGNGLEVYQELRQADAKTPVVFVTAHGTTETAIEAMKGGGFDYLVKPVDLGRMTTVLDRALEAARLMSTPAVLPSEDVADRIVGRSPAMQEMSKHIGRIAPQDVNVLILGESGTGKELVARALYQHSPRSGMPFLVINCAAIPENLLESELFGHEAGAFTGAVRRQIGRFEQCHGGTLFFDEIGDMSLTLQAKLLRIVQEQRFERVGGRETIQTDVRLLAATNQNLEELVKAGRFRADLYYRLKVVTISLPPLRERFGDVAELAHYFLFKFNRKLGLVLRGFHPEALARLESYRWPGNVRQLQGVIQQAMVSASGHVITPDYLPADLSSPTSATSSASHSTRLLELFESADREYPGHIHGKVMEEVERQLIQHVLGVTHGNQSQASELLGINRATLRAKLKQFGISIEKVVGGDQPNSE